MPGFFRFSWREVRLRAAPVGTRLLTTPRLPTASGSLDNADRIFVLGKLFHSAENLQETTRTNSLHGSEESKNALRELVDAVIINPPENRERN